MRDLQQLAENTELNTYSIQQIKLGSVDAYDVQLSKFLLKFYLYTILDTLISIKKSDILAVNKETSTASMKFGQKDDEEEEEEEDEDTSDDVEAGKEKKLEEMLAEIVVTFTDLLCSDKKVIDVNYTTLMEKVLRSKEKEKDNITTAFKEMNDDEKQIENIFKDMRLERWSKGLQKGLFVYNKATYEEESVLMEKQKLLDLKRAKRAETSKISIDDEDALNADENEEERIENEDMEIHYAGEAENDDYDDLDGDEYFP
jgi:hypothetical protein